MKIESLAVFFRTYVSFLFLFLWLVPSTGLAFDLTSAYERGVQSFGQVKESAREIYQDNLVFDDAAINREVEPLLITLRERQRERVRRINELMLENRPLAIDLEQEEARKYCAISPIEAKLKSLIEQNCKILIIRDKCESLALSTVDPMAAKSQALIAETSRDISIVKILKLERELVDNFRAIQEANKTCSHAYGSAILGDACKYTYKNFFAEFQEEFVNRCSDSSVIESLERFTSEMREFDVSSRVHLAEALAIHSKSRTAEINLARTIEQINATRLRLEHAAGKGTGSVRRQPAEQPAQLENYHGS